MADERFTEAIKIKNALTALVASEGWGLLDAVLKEKEENMLGTILDPGQELSDTTLREYRMALVSLRTIRATPAAMLENAVEVIAEFADENAEEEEDNSDGEEEYTV